MQLHLASIVESAGDLIISTDPNGAIMTWNAAAEKATGYTHVEMRGSQFCGSCRRTANSRGEKLFQSESPRSTIAIRLSGRCDAGTVTAYQCPGVYRV